jgi:hypothetical protein
MDNEHEELIQDIIRVIAEGYPVDWEGLDREYPCLRDDLAALRKIAGVSGAYRSLRNGKPDPA